MPRVNNLYRVTYTNLEEGPDPSGAGALTDIVMKKCAKAALYIVILCDQREKGIQ